MRQLRIKYSVTTDPMLRRRPGRHVATKNMSSYLDPCETTAGSPPAKRRRLDEETCTLNSNGEIRESINGTFDKRWSRQPRNSERLEPNSLSISNLGDSQPTAGSAAKSSMSKSTDQGRKGSHRREDEESKAGDEVKSHSELSDKKSPFEGLTCFGMVNNGFESKVLRSPANSVRSLIFPSKS